MAHVTIVQFVRHLRRVQGPYASAASGDHELLECFATQGDEAAFATLVQRHGPMVRGLCRRLLGNPHDAEDVLQVTFLRAAKIAGAFDGRALGARAWLFGIAGHVIQERRRSLLRFSRAVPRLGTGAMVGSIPTETHRSDLDRGLRRLSQAKRVVLILAEVEEFTCEEIATMLGVPVGTVWTRLHNARKELRKFYEEDA